MHAQIGLRVHDTLKVVTGSGLQTNEAVEHVEEQLTKVILPDGKSVSLILSQGLFERKI